MEHFLLFYEYLIRTMSFKLLLLAPILSLVISAQHSYAQLKLSGTWRGIEIIDSSDVGAVYELNFKIINGLLDGIIKVEVDNKDVYVNKIIGTKKYVDLTIKESSSIYNSKGKTNKKNNFALQYNPETGYLESPYDSLRKSIIVLFQDDFSFNAKSKSIESRHWINSFVQNYHAGLSAPKKRLEELREFEFIPIYFDVDRAIILEQYHAQLLEIIKITKSHSDLRIQVTGHTDSDGSKTYNRHLSKRRAESIIKFFTKRGLRRDRIVIDFKGENEPAETNQTREGKSKNRRVDFTFI